MSEKLRKRLFQLTVLANFIMVFIYQYLTPYMSDDVIYWDEVAKANNFFDLFAQEYAQYLDHSGRSVAHIILRIFLYADNKLIFDVVAACVFVLVSMLIYINVDHRKAYDIRVYSAIMLLLWLFDPTINNSVFWMDGACNYMFTGCIVLGFVTLFRKSVKASRLGTIGFAIGMFFYGVVAGWCNENTSGAIMVYMLVMMFAVYKKDKNIRNLRPWMIAGFVGTLTGFVIMITAPGNLKRAAAAEEAHTGLLALLARFLKITLNIKNGYLILVFVFIAIAIAIAYKCKNTADFLDKASGMLLFGFLFLITCYALLAVPNSQLRTYYGASLFLMTAIVSGFAWLVNEGYDEALVQTIATSLVTIFGVLLIFTYIEEGANLARIKREFDERDAYLTELAKTGADDVYAPMLRPDWESRYSMAYVSDYTEDPLYWLNLAYAQHYGFDTVAGIPREDWTEY